ncbi:MAG: hypothetical protein WDZ69_00450 [Candidatus Pacearchaeota archaeon]
MEEQMSIYYDEEGDYLEVMFGKSDSDYGDHLSEDIVLFKDQKTENILGIGVFNFKKHTKELDDLKVKLPVKINLSALKV